MHSNQTAKVTQICKLDIQCFVHCNKEGAKSFLLPLTPLEAVLANVTTEINMKTKTLPSEGHLKPVVYRLSCGVTRRYLFSYVICAKSLSAAI